MEKTFDFQDSLPNIDIPELAETCSKFIEWVRPLLTKEEFENTKSIVEKFKSNDGEGVKLQNELIKWSERNNLTNWTAPFWEDIYLKPRVPLIVEGNVFYLIKNKLKKANLTQIEISTIIILSVLKFKALIDSEKLEVDLQKGIPLCMEQYKRFFSSTRIPRKEKDELRISHHQRHIIVLHKGNIFSVNVFSDSGNLKTYTEIKEELDHIISINQNRQGQGVGVLTSIDRDKWADIRKKILVIDYSNKEYIDKIETAIFALCLDDLCPENLVDTSKLMLHGDGRNRWFDKSLQFIVSKNGEIGINMEHTGMDGSPMSRLIKFIYDDMSIPEEKEKRTLKEKPKKLDFYLNDEIERKIEDATKQFNKTTSNQETRVLIFNKFGTNGIKKHDISPDAFVQIALQLAQYKLYGKCYSAYEAVMTRKFLHGRIEVMYTVSQESIKFIESMVSKAWDNNRKRKFLAIAAQKHIDRIKECQNGKGIDGHLMALFKIYGMFGENMGLHEVPDIFTDKGYNILTHSTICTSTTSPHGLELAGYGPVVEDGFGLRYIKDKNNIRFNITSKKYMEQELDKLVAYIEESLLEMAELMES